MAETEQVIRIGQYSWYRVPDDSTQFGPVYSEPFVRAYGGDLAIVKDVVIYQKELKEGENEAIVIGDGMRQKTTARSK